ncbi:hypothetical protein Tco_0012701 [Tanacetum coccineum]
MDFANPVKAISLPQDVPSTSDRRLIELQNQVPRLMEAHLAPMQLTQVNKITTSYEICSGPHDTQYYMENPEQAFVEYASSRTDEAGSKWYTFKPEQNNLGDTYNPSWKSYPNLSFNNQSNLEGLVSNFMASQDARLSKFKANFKQQQSEMTNKIDTVLKAITDRVARAFPSEKIKNPKLNVNSTTLVLSARSYPTEDPQFSTHIHGLINTIMIHPKQQSNSHDSKADEEERERKGDPKDTNTIAYNKEQRDMPQLEQKDITAIDNLRPNRDDEGIEWLDVEEPLDLVDISEESVYKSLIKKMPKCSLNYGFKIKKGDPRNLKIPCMIDEIKEITFKTPYKDPDWSELSSEGHDLLPSRVILSEDDYDRGCRKPSYLEDGFYRDTIKLGPEYVTGMDDEGEVTLYLMRRSLEVLRTFHWMVLRGRFNQLSHVSSPLLSKPGEY